MIRFDHVSYSYPSTKRLALHDVNLQIEESTVTAVLGANGAGKSTLCAAIAGFIPHHYHGELCGRVLVNRMDTAATPLVDLIRQVGFVFQNPLNQLSGARLTVEEEVAFGLENLGVPRKVMAQRVGDALELMGLANLATRPPYALSGGEQQRLALACILVMEPHVLVLDEPTAQLDAVGAQQVYDSVRSLVSRQRATVILVEHKTEWIAEFADRVLVLAEGAVVLDGRPHTVLTDDRLADLGVRPLHYTQAARAARKAGIWPVGTPFPITLKETVLGLQSFPEPEVAGK